MSAIPTIFRITDQTGRLVFDDHQEKFVAYARSHGIGTAEKEENMKAWRVFAEKLQEVYQAGLPSDVNFSDNEEDLTPRRFIAIVAEFAQKYLVVLPTINAVEITPPIPAVRSAPASVPAPKKNNMSSSLKDDINDV